MIRFDSVSFTYPHHNVAALREVSLTFRRGSFTVLTGPTGCGKSTMLKCMAGIIPHRSKGCMKGTVYVAGMDSRQSSIAEITQHVGMVFQCPDDQLFATTVAAEIAFGPENMGLAAGEVSERTRQVLSEVGLEGFESRLTKALSGGQKQRVAIAAQLATRPDILILDEPVSQLDPEGASEVLSCIERLNREGTTIVLVEHRLGDSLKLATDVVIMNEGEVSFSGDRDSSFRTCLYEELGLQIPDPVILHKQLGATGEIEWNPAGAADKLRGRVRSVSDFSLKKVERVTVSHDIALKLQDVEFGYSHAMPPVMSGVDLEIRRGDRVAVMGPNGGGKSTILGLLAGLLKPWQGSVIHPPLEKIGYLFQNPDLMLFCPTLKEEMEFGRWHRNLGCEEKEKRCRLVCKELGVFDFIERPATSLSRGQRLRAALSVILAPRPDILFLDEPTSGQDRENINQMMDHLLDLAHVNTLVFCTHDLEVALEHATRLLLVMNGKIVADGVPREIAKDHDILSSCSLRLPFAHEVAHELDHDNLGWMSMGELCEAMA